MKKIIFYCLFLLLVGHQHYAQVTALRIGSDLTTSMSSYTFSSTDVMYFNSTGGNFTNSGTGNLCVSSLRRTQLRSVILHLNSSATNIILVHATSSGSSSRFLSNL